MYSLFSLLSIFSSVLLHTHMHLFCHIMAWVWLSSVDISVSITIFFFFTKPTHPLNKHHYAIRHHDVDLVLWEMLTQLRTAASCIIFSIAKKLLATHSIKDSNIPELKQEYFSTNHISHNFRFIQSKLNYKTLKRQNILLCQLVKKAC
jgi:hypothetical protein